MARPTPSMAAGLPSSPARPVSLALQGGGAHGAFTWGVLDKLAEDGRIQPTAMTATSAGAMNAVVFADGLRRDGPDGGREALESFWRKVSRSGSAFHPTSVPGAEAASHFFPFMDALSRVTSPYDLNPFDYNPLRDILRDCVDFKALPTCKDLQLFICATSVKTGRPRVFSGTDITVDSVLASACLPFLFQAVEINGEPHWDGGYTGNPAIWPLYYVDTPRDILIVNLNPIERADTPKSAADIMNRVNEITFNASLLAELRALAFVKDLIANDQLKGEVRDNFRDMLVHAIRGDDSVRNLRRDSKYDTRWSSLTALRDEGRKAAHDWLESCADDVGTRSTIELHADFLRS
ncbi:patatin-like phospholipase family protein [Hyphobacterium sp.]|uniref:patatin-like phospholipase family protein n=1 Tax=Hyphobacterium sp. TaxID=2004662 RepID=UPI003B519451